MAKSKSLTEQEEKDIKQIKDDIKSKITKAGINGISVSKAAEIFKDSFDGAITKAGDKGKDSLIRSQEPIKIFHELVKQELIKAGVNKKLIFPELGKNNGELNLFGYFKDKTQDVVAISNAAKASPEILSSGLLHGKTDPHGKKFTEQTLVINVRSQMSSIAKNVDTMFERIFAEPLNLHMRCPKLVMGEFYIIPTTGYDSDLVKQKKPVFCPKVTIKKGKKKTTAEVLEEYILAFDSVNSRDFNKKEDYKYEKVCLLIIDFNVKPYKVYKSQQELIKDGLLPPGSIANYDNLSYSTFVSDLIEIYESRFGSNKLS